MALARIYTARDSLEAGFVCALLEQEGIHATTLGEQLTALRGAVPFGETTAPAVWVPQEVAESARQIVANALHEAKLARGRGDYWVCSGCGETVSAAMGTCWNCLTDRGEAPTDATIESPLQEDFECIECGYNLRGLMPDGRCPECGEKIESSLLEASHFTKPRGRRSWIVWAILIFLLLMLLF